MDFRTISNAVYARRHFNGRDGWMVNFAKGQPSRHLWIGSIHPQVDERYLVEVFSRYGQIEQCKKLQRSNCAFIGNLIMVFLYIPPFSRKFHRF